MTPISPALRSRAMSTPPHQPGSAGPSVCRAGGRRLTPRKHLAPRPSPSRPRSATERDAAHRRLLVLLVIFMAALPMTRGWHRPPGRSDGRRRARADRLEVTADHRFNKRHVSSPLPSPWGVFATRARAVPRWPRLPCPVVRSSTRPAGTTAARRDGAGRAGIASRPLFVGSFAARGRTRGQRGGHGPQPTIRRAISIGSLPPEPDHLEPDEASQPVVQQVEPLHGAGQQEAIARRPRIAHSSR